MNFQIDAEAGHAAEEPHAPIRLTAAGPGRADIVLRPINLDDTPFLQELYASTRFDELRVTPWTDVERRAFCDSQFALQDTYYRQTYPHARYDVIEVTGRPVGRFLVATGPDAAVVLDIALTPAERGRGLGATLLRWQQARAAAGGQAVTLMVEPLSRAEHLYERLGFRQRTDGELHREMIWRAKAVGEEALTQFLDLALDDPDLRADLGSAQTDADLTDGAIALGLACGLAFGPENVVDALRTRRRAWLERAIR